MPGGGPREQSPHPARDMAGAESRLAHELGEVGALEPHLAVEHIALLAPESGVGGQRPGVVEMERVRGVPGLVGRPRAQVHGHRSLGDGLHLHIGRRGLLQLDRAQLVDNPRGEHAVQERGIEPPLLHLHRGEGGLGGGVGRSETAVLLDLGGTLVGADPPRQGDDLLLVHAHQRAQQGELRGARHHRHVLQRLRGDLPHRVPGDQRLQLQLPRQPLSRPQHQTLQHHLPVLGEHLGLDLLHHGLEVHLVEVGPFAVAPEVGQDLHHPQHPAPVRDPAQVAEEVVEGHAAPQQHPGGHRGVEPARDQRERTPLHPHGKPPLRGHHLGEEIGLLGVHLQVDGHLRRAQVDAARMLEEGGPERALEIRGAEGDELGLARAARAHREALAAHGLCKCGLRLAHQAGHVPPGDAADGGDGLEPEDMGQDVQRQGGRGLDEHAVPLALDAIPGPGGPQRVADILAEPLGEPLLGLRRLDGDLPRVTEEDPSGFVVVEGQERSPMWPEPSTVPA